MRPREQMGRYPRRRQYITMLAFNTDIVNELKERMEKPPEDRTPSEYQRAILNWAQGGGWGSARIDAVAGSGKSTLLEMLLRALKGPDDSVQIRTLNSLGNGAVFNRLGRVKLDEGKTWSIAKNLIDPDRRIDYGSEVVQLVGLAKAYGLAPTGVGDVRGLMPDTDDSWRWLIEQFDLDIKAHHVGEAVAVARDTLRYGLLDLNVIDFDDQKYLPVVLDWPLFRVNWVLLDEAQDCSPIDTALVRKALMRNARVVFVGDENQSIYLFRGSDSESMDKLQVAFNAKRFPLSVCYRCAQSIVREAQAYVPHIEAAPGAPEGEVTALEYYSKADFDSGDLVVCRNTAPLIKLAYGLMAQGQAVEVKGRKIGENLVRLIQKMKATTVDASDPDDVYDDCLVARLDAWKEKEIERLTAKGQESRIDAVEDKHESIMVFIEATAPESVEALVRYIEGMFDAGVAPVTLCTIHKAKGLEAERVFILDFGLMPSQWARTEQALQQERNLQYVAITRGKYALTYIGSDGLKTPQEKAAIERALAEQAGDVVNA